jgi:hypothetical protein
VIEIDEVVMRRRARVRGLQMYRFVRAGVVTTLTPGGLAPFGIMSLKSITTLVEVFRNSPVRIESLAS